ncbi:MAG: ATP-binding protein [Bacteroides sp.]
MIERDIAGRLLFLIEKFPIVTLTGPRQSGKSTLLKNILTDYHYVSLEDPDLMAFARDDPRSFIRTYADKTIIDEAQRVPALFSYLQTHTDLAGREGMYCLAGSHNFLLMESISQSLAGRTAILKLLPFSHSEMCNAKILPKTTDEEIFYGSYPRIFDKSIAPTDYYPPYIQTYLERDVRTLKNIGNMTDFLRFTQLCAGRIGQLLNLSSLANDCSISVSTASAWLSILETSYICYTLRPDHRNYTKRLVKTPKLYFHDTGLACALLGIRSAMQVNTHYLRGALFENLVINEFIKAALHRGQEPVLSFWRDKMGLELDLVSYCEEQIEVYEIKSGATYSSDFFKNLTKWAKLSGFRPEQCHVIYDGEMDLTTTEGHVHAWKTLNL